MQRGRKSWDEAVALECLICSAERRRRAWLMTDDAEHIRPEFGVAPYITHMNRPKHLASQERARIFAQYHGRQLLWYRARDVPTSGEIMSLRGEELQRARERWWKRHDQHTNGIMGLMPLVYDLPIIFTQTVDALRKIYKFTRGLLKGWELSEYDAAVVRGSTEPEIVLERCPKRLLIKKNGQDMLQHYNLEPQMYALAPRRSDWSVDPDGLNMVRRLGFTCAPDIGATIHSVTGQEFAAIILDLRHLWDRVNLESMLMAFIGMSRVKTADGLLLAAPFSPCLFRQGQLPGPSTLMEFLRGHISEERLQEVVEEVEQARRTQRPNLLSMWGRVKTPLAFS